jgi:uncharacterized protein (TIGR02001 family)
MVIRKRGCEMKKVLIVMMLVMAAVSGMAEGASGSSRLDAAYGYLYRGETYNDGLVLQPSCDLSLEDLSVGVWANYDVDDYDGMVDENEFSEIDLYGAYALPLDLDPVSVSVGYLAYIYPLNSTDADHEVSLTVELDAVLSPSIAMNYGIDGGIKESLYIELGASQSVYRNDCLELEVAAALGYVKPDVGESGFSHLDIGLSASAGIFSAGINYVAQIDEDVLPDLKDGGAYDAEVYGVVGAGVEF